MAETKPDDPLDTKPYVPLVTKSDEPLVKVEVEAEPANEPTGVTTAADATGSAKAAETAEPGKAEEAANAAAKGAETEPPKTMPLWQTKVWLRVVQGFGVCSFLLICLVGYSVYQTAMIITNKSGTDLAFTFSGIALLNTVLLRLLAILIGSAIIFGGLAISFFSSNDTNRISLQANQAAGDSYKAMVASRTPGIVGIFMGGIIIIASLFDTGNFQYSAPEKITYYPPASAAKPASTPAVVTDIPTVEDAKKATSASPVESTNVGNAK